MAIVTTASVSKIIEYTNISDPDNIHDVKLQARFNGKVYNGKRYINIGSITLIWVDGYGWEIPKYGRYAFSDLVVEAFELK